MNNQRERRYKFMDEVRLFREKGGETSDCQDFFDSNSISPGTAFMLQLNQQLESFIYAKLGSDPHWQQLEVVFSGVDVPGEGEHKMMQYIREHQGGGVRHCLYGLDADLIVLGLASHQPYVVVLREEVNLTYIRESPPRKLIGSSTKFELIHLPLVREYLQCDFSSVPGLDLERLIDDFVLFVAFVGNDFIPRLPTFEISEGSLDVLIETYKRLWKDVGYLSSNGAVNWTALAKFLVDLPQHEKKALEDRINAKGKRRENEPIPADKQALSLKKIYQEGVNQAYKELQRRKKQSESEDTEEEVKEEGEENGENQDSEEIRQRLKSELQTGGIELIKARYYQDCFGFNISQEPGQLQIRFAIREYLRGLQWVLFYYYRGCPDWEWYYPFHYAPMISDFQDIGEMMGVAEGGEMQFAENRPYKPLEQLVSVLPPGSAGLLPAGYSDILTSPAHDRYFPKKPRIEYDFLCAKVGWQSLKIVLPFVSRALVTELTAAVPETPEIAAINAERTDCSFRWNSHGPPAPVTMCKFLRSWGNCGHEGHLRASAAIAKVQLSSENDGNFDLSP